jgi:ABC-type multidrug transport system permease subunit
MQYVRSLGRWDKGLIDQAFDLAQRTSVLYCGLSYSNTLLVSIHGPQYGLVMHSCQKIPLQYLLSSLNALISTNKRHWIIASHAIFMFLCDNFFNFQAK